MKHSSAHNTIVLLVAPLAILFSLRAVAVDSEYLCEGSSYTGKDSITVKAASIKEAEKKAASAFEKYGSTSIICQKK